jgi:hypothetical protein
MMRGVVVYGALLAVTLGASYYRWTHEPDKNLEGKVVVLQGEKDTLDKITWKGKDDEAVIEKKKDDKGDFFWVTYTKWEKKKPEHPETKPEHPDAKGSGSGSGAAAAGSGSGSGADVAAAGTGSGSGAAVPEKEEEKEPVVSYFKSGKASTDLVTALSPLFAVRKLEDVTPDKLKTIEMETPVEHLLIERNGKTTDIELGGEAYGTKDRYGRIAGTNDIYLIDDEVLRSLKFARTRLPDRDLFPFETPKIESAVVGDGGSSIKLTQKNRDDKDKATWAPADSPDDASAQYKTWMDKFLKTKASSYVNEADVPKGLELRFQVTLHADGGGEETVDVYQDGSAGDWYAKSGYTREYVKMLKSTTSSLSEDVGPLIGESTKP